MPTLTHEPDTVTGRSPLVTPLDLAYLIYLYPVRFAARIMPPRVFLVICESLIRLGGVAWRRTRDRAARNMRTVFPAATDDEIRAWAGAAVGGSLNRAFQDLVTRRLIAGDHLKHVKITGLHHLEAARSEGRGVLVFSGHFLATRLARCYLEARGVPMLATRLGRPPARRVGRIGRRLQPSYLRLLNDVIRNEVLVEEPGSSLRILRRLREGGIVNALLDTGIRRNLSAQTQPGRPTPRSAGILEVVRLTRAPMVPVAWFGDWRSLTIEFLQPLDLVDAHDRPSFVAANMPRIFATLEELIRRHPEQWEVFGWAWRTGDAFRRS
jgi:lauroyl/myristoyl acyltransferase